MINEEYITNNDFNGLLIKNTRYIERKANSFDQDYDTVKDLEQAGRIGLWNAFNKYNPEIGPFWPLAIIHIFKEMTAHLDKYSRTIYIPRKAKVHPDFICTTNTTSINTPINDENMTYESVLGESDPIIPEKDNTVLNAIESLKPQYQQIAKMLYGFPPYEDPLTQKEIGDKLGLSRQDIHQKLNKIKSTLKIVLNEYNNRPKEV